MNSVMLHIFEYLYSPRSWNTMTKGKAYTRSLSKLGRRVKKRRRKIQRRARRKALKLDKRISEDECDFDFDNSTRPLCSTSEDDSDLPEGESF